MKHIEPYKIIIYIIPALTLIYFLIRWEAHLAYNMKFTYSVADSYCRLTNFEVFVPDILILYSVYFNLSVFDDLKYSEVVRYKSRGEIWVKQVSRMLVTSLLLSVFLIISTFIISLFFSESLINFDQTNSLFYYTTSAYSGPTLENPFGITFAQVIVFSIISIYFAILILSAIAFLIRWVTNNLYLSWLSIIFIIVVDLAVEYPVLIKNLSNYYPHLLNISNMVMRLLSPVILFLLIYVAGFISSKRKDFYS